MPLRSSSVPLSWDLRSPSSPRSLCIFRPPNDATNPFESATEEAIIFGTERGSLHYRCYHAEGHGLLQPLESSRSTQPINQSSIISGSGSIVSIVPVGPNAFLLLIDDNRGTSASQPGAYASQLIVLRQGSFQILPFKTPRMSCATYSNEIGLVYSAGRQIANLLHDSFGKSNGSGASSLSFHHATALPLPGVRSGHDSLEVTCNSQIVVAAVGSVFYAVSIASGTTSKILSFNNSSQVHPILIRDIKDKSTDWSVIILCSARECAIVDLWKPPDADAVTAVPRHSIQTPSPILNVATLWPWIALLTSDGLISMRSPLCLAIPLRTVEIGTRPNDFFALHKVSVDTIASLSYGGECLLIKCCPDTKQDLADRLMRLAVDAFGSNGFPRSQVAEAVSASFTATSYVGLEANATARALLKQYLEALLGLADFVSASTSTWPGVEDTFSVCATALLCLACAYDSTNASLANRAAKEACNKVGICFARSDDPTVQVCELVAEKMLHEATQSIELLNASPAIVSVNKQNKHLAFIEAAIWLMRACGRHERSFEILEKRLRPNEGGWSAIKYESFIATHLSDLWTHGGGEELVLTFPATVRLLETNPTLGLSVFTARHPHSVDHWKKMLARDDPLNHHASEVVELLRSVKPIVREDEQCKEEEFRLPLDTGRALAVTFLESAIGIYSGRPTQIDGFDELPPDPAIENAVAGLHDELSYLLLEGIITERGDSDEGQDRSTGKIYRNKLRHFLRWPGAKLRSERLVALLPSSFLEEQALLLGRLGRHEDALRMLYVDCKNLDLALQYCDSRHALKGSKDKKCAYLPLIRVALEADPDPTQSSAIQVLAMRSHVIDRAAALRLLPKSVPVSAVARPFLIPALVDSESEIRRLTVTSALLRSKFLSLKQKLTDAQLKAQSTLQGVHQLRKMKLGDPLYSTKPSRIRPSHTASSTFPELMIIKHFFARHLVIQAKVSNTSNSIEGRALCDVTFVVAESSEEAIQPALQVPLKMLPFQSTGCAWCVLLANPQRMDGIAILACELRYIVSTVDSTGMPLSFSGAVNGRSYVEELQDVEVHASNFS